MTESVRTRPLGNDFYARLTERNAGVITPDAQRALAAARLLIAGCGSIGGAAAEPLARLGVQHFAVADPGEYELNNLNRQDASVGDIGRNKAEVAAERITEVNPLAEVRVFPQGVTAETITELTEGRDMVVDGIDVTTMSGLQAKFLLHQQAVRQRLPLITGWDMAGAQYVRFYDYRTTRLPFEGKVTRADLDSLGMWPLLQRLIPARFVPLEMVTVAAANFRNPDFSFPQLVYAADLFGALSAHAVAQLLTGQPVRKHIYVDLHQAVRPTLPRWRARIERPLRAASVVAQLRRSATA